MDNRNSKAYNSSRQVGRYTRGGIVDIYNTRIGWWERIAMKPDVTDDFFDVTNETAFRPDLIAYKYYGDPTYAWLVLQFNNIVDIHEELQVGVVLKLPTVKRLNTLLLANSSGGNTVST